MPDALNGQRRRLRNLDALHAVLLKCGADRQNRRGDAGHYLGYAAVDRAGRLRVCNAAPDQWRSVDEDELPLDADRLGVVAFYFNHAGDIRVAEGLETSPKSAVRFVCAAGHRYRVEPLYLVDVVKAAWSAPAGIFYESTLPWRDDA